MGRRPYPAPPGGQPPGTAVEGVLASGNAASALTTFASLVSGRLGNERRLVVVHSWVDTLVCVELGAKRVFASALEWPGWCRSGRTEAEALEALAAYLSRYEPIVALAGDRRPPRAADGFEVIERLAGNASTDFGAPGVLAEYDSKVLEAKQGERLGRLVAGCWHYLGDVVASAPAELRKGPRGGGRDRDQIDRHVAEAEISYARKLGIRGGQDLGDVRRRIVEVLGTPSDGRPPAERGWPPRYAARRIAWHVLDHAWEIEDKS